MIDASAAEQILTISSSAKFDFVSQSFHLYLVCLSLVCCGILDPWLDSSLKLMYCYICATGIKVE